MSTVLVTGATGYIGGRLVPALLEAGHRVRCMARSPSKLDGQPWRGDVEVVEGDVLSAESCRAALDSVDAAFFLVHSMGSSSGDFADVDRQAAATFRDAAADAAIGRIVYLGGLGDDEDPALSNHLRSRHEVGRVLAEGPVPVIELRAAIIIGSGSASFEMLRYLVEVLPVMVTPRWVDNRCQPIAIRDVLAWLVHVVDIEPPTSGHDVVEIGGPDVLTYREMMQTYAALAGLRPRRIWAVPVLTPWLSSLWIGLVTPLPSGLARPLVESLINEVVVQVAPRVPPPPTEGDGAPMPFARAVELALGHSADLQIATRWSDATLPGRSSAGPLPTDPDWAGGSLLIDHQQARSDADVHTVFARLSGIGGDRGWFVAPVLWQLRGVLDKLVGGVGLRRGRRHPDDLRIGDALDFWRVEAVEPDRLIRLRAEMRLPGEAWLEWHLAPDDGGGTFVEQRAIFYPRGLLGRAYWYALLPFHALIFGRLARRLAEGDPPPARLTRWLPRGRRRRTPTRR